MNIESPAITLLGTEVRLKFGLYGNGTIAITAIVADETGEPFCVATVNYEQFWEGAQPYGEFWKFPSVVIKDYSENQGIYDDLIRAKVITPGAYLAGSNGGVKAAMLTPEWQEIAKKQGFKE